MSPENLLMAPAAVIAQPHCVCNLPLNVNLNRMGLRLLHTCVEQQIKFDRYAVQTDMRRLSKVVLSQRLVRCGQCWRQQLYQALRRVLSVRQTAEGLVVLRASPMRCRRSRAWC